ncbi:RES family NAD+ phosphorylase [Sphingomonas sp. CL5.1]|uniref:RES family NAD+ phosphorylase n=1 Tax=Sphingomonas sp. CL5.1 TaxID=2653203 RepID=UPI001582F84F|nr:RES family NAD+ phosphorylase [Sphingomonas sp. CL5.1]QKR98862.1 RES family NAD+ phosphorylase [Sphingomonas sp. CL5.1]
MALPLRPVSGIFFRAVDPLHAAGALSGSRGDGRYSRRGQPTLYLSASRAGVEAALIAHRAADEQERIVLQFAVAADRIADLRDADTLARVREEAGDPFADWRGIAAPPSWRVRDWIEARGADGLIDPSRKAPGLWHLVLFRWNIPGAPTVRAQ